MYGPERLRATAGTNPESDAGTVEAERPEEFEELNDSVQECSRLEDRTPEKLTMLWTHAVLLFQTLASDGKSRKAKRVVLNFLFSRLPDLAATAEAYRPVAAETPGPWAIVQCTEGGRLLPKERIAELVWAEARKVLYNP